MTIGIFKHITLTGGEARNSVPDALLAALAIRHEADFITADADFQHPVRTSTKAPQPDLADPDFDEAEYIERYIRLGHGQEDNPYVDWTADGYRLPTEGEWMYGITVLGIHDMSGNVAEMVWDFRAAYPDTPQQSFEHGA